MRSFVCPFVACFVLAEFLCAGPAAARDQVPRAWEEKRIALPLVGSGDAYVPHAPTTRVALLLDGSGGRDKDLIALAQRAAPSAVVVIVSYSALHQHAARQFDWGCWYIAADLEVISRAAQKALGLPQYHPPVLVGYEAGAATAVYAALAGAPAVTFVGGISIGFCPTLAVNREVCAGDAWTPDYNEKKRTNALPPTRNLQKAWVVLQGARDTACSVDSVRQFTAGMPNSRVVAVAGGGRKVSKDADWGSPFDQALEAVWSVKDVKPASAHASSATTRELETELQTLQLPLEYRWPANVSALLLFFSGDGGWASLDEEVSELLVARGIGVVGVSSLRYFWTTKGPPQVAADIRRLVNALGRSGKPVFAGGYSFGAEVVPVALREWSAADWRALDGLVLVGPGPSASFEIDPLDWVRTPAENAATRVAPAVRAIGLPVLCLAGSREEDTACTALDGAPGVATTRLAGSHHFDGNYPAVADKIGQFIHTVSLERRP